MFRASYYFFVWFLFLFLGLATMGNIAEARHQEFKRGGNFLVGGDKLNIYFFKDKDFCLKILDEGDSTENRNYGGHEKAFSQAGCVAGINGGYFTKENKPLGLVMHNGKRLHTLETGSFAVSGLIYDDGKKIGLIRSKTLLDWPEKRRNSLKEAVQGGPFLVENGKKIKGLDDQKAAVRTFIATDGKGNWCLGVSSSLTLNAIADWLSSPSALGSFTVKDALNLDGGSSTLFWVSGSGSRMSPIKPVRNYIGIAPR